MTVNEMIDLILLYVLGKVLWPVWDGCYAVLKDETRHNSNKEQFVTVLQRVDDTFAVCQDFVLFVSPKTDAHTIFTVLNDVLTQCNILPGCAEGRHTTVLCTCQATWRESLQTLKCTILHQYLPDQALPQTKPWIQVSTKWKTQTRKPVNALSNTMDGDNCRFKDGQLLLACRCDGRVLRGFP